jgi:putative sigma-54 modulation protein
MELNITARHLKLTPAIADYVQKKLEKAKRFFGHLIWAQIILEVQKNRHIAEIVVHTTGRTLMAKKESIDLYAAIDLASDKIDEQLRRYKERRQLRRSVRGPQTPEATWTEAPSELGGVDRRISSLRVVRLSPQSMEEALSTMANSDNAHCVFLNKQNGRVTVIYRKPDKTFGVVESIP